MEEKNLTEEDIFSSVERSIRKYFGRRGEQVVSDNMECVRRGFTEIHELPSEMIHKMADLELVE